MKNELKGFSMNKEIFFSMNLNCIHFIIYSIIFLYELFNLLFLWFLTIKIFIFFVLISRNFFAYCKFQLMVLIRSENTCCRKRKFINVIEILNSLKL